MALSSHRKTLEVPGRQDDKALYDTVNRWIPLWTGVLLNWTLVGMHLPANPTALITHAYVRAIDHCPPLFLRHINQVAYSHRTPIASSGRESKGAATSRRENHSAF